MSEPISLLKTLENLNTDEIAEATNDATIDALLREVRHLF